MVASKSIKSNIPLLRRTRHILSSKQRSFVVVDQGSLQEVSPLKNSEFFRATLLLHSLLALIKASRCEKKNWCEFGQGSSKIMHHLRRIHLPLLDSRDWLTELRNGWEKSSKMAAILTLIFLLQAFQILPILANNPPQFVLNDNERGGDIVLR